MGGRADRVGQAASIRRNSPQPASEIARAKLRFLTMPFTARSSITMTDLVFVSLVESW
jgi:hypothetical protein